MGLIPIRKHPQKLAVVHQYLVAILASLPFAVAGAAVAWPSQILPNILSGETLISLSTTETSWMVSLIYIGEVVGTLPSAYLSDKIGRKRTLVWCGVFPVISWSIILSSGDTLWICISRFMAGLQVGVITVVYPLYIGEVSQTDIRGSLTALSSVTMNAGIFFVSIVGPFVSPQVLVSIVLFLSSIFSLGTHFAPESPHFLLARNDITGARDSLLWLRGGLNRIELEFELDRIEKVVQTQKVSRSSMEEVLSSAMPRKCLVVVLILSALDGLSGVKVIQAFTTSTLPKITFGILTPKDCMIILSSATLVSSFIATCLPDMFHGKMLGVVSYLGCSFFTDVVAVWFFLSSNTEVDVSSVDFIPFLGCLTHLIIYSFINSYIFILINNQDLSLKSKTNLILVSTVTKATVNFVLNKIYLMISYQMGVYVNFVIYSVGCLVAAPFSAIFWFSMVNDGIGQNKQDMSTEDEDNKISITVVDGTF